MSKEITNEQLYEFMTMMYSELTGKIEGIDGEVKGIKGEIKEIKKDIKELKSDATKTNEILNTILNLKYQLYLMSMGNISKFV